MVGGILEECSLNRIDRFMGDLFHQERPLLIIKIPLRNARVYIIIFR